MTLQFLKITDFIHLAICQYFVNPCHGFFLFKSTVYVLMMLTQKKSIMSLEMS